MDKRILAKEINDVLNIGYKTVVKGAGGFTLEKKTADGVNIILFGYVVYPGSKYLRESLGGYKVFNVVEDLLKKYYLPNNINLNNYTIYCRSKRNDFLTQMPLNNKSDLENLLPTIQFMVKDEILPFFDQYSIIENVIEAIEPLSDDEIKNIIYKPHLIRVMILKCLAKTTDWREYAQKVLNIYKEHSTGRYAASFAPFYNFLPQLISDMEGRNNG